MTTILLVRFSMQDSDPLMEISIIIYDYDSLIIILDNKNIVWHLQQSHGQN